MIKVYERCIVLADIKNRCNGVKMDCNQGKKCSFFGHRDVSVTSELENNITEILTELIVDKGVSIFYFGGFGDFDACCYRIVTKLKNTYAHLQRIYCLADKRHLRESKRPKHLAKDSYEEYVYLELQYDYWYTRIYYRNCEMINLSDYILFYVKCTNNSGAYKCMKYAERVKKNIIKI